MIDEARIVTVFKVLRTFDLMASGAVHFTGSFSAATSIEMSLASPKSETWETENTTLSHRHPYSMSP